MNNKFDELTKSVAQSVTRRVALKKFGLGLAGMALACLGLSNKAEAFGGPNGCFKQCLRDCLNSGEASTFCHAYCSVQCGIKG
jgi:hypothetical protein